MSKNYGNDKSPPATSGPEAAPSPQTRGAGLLESMKQAKDYVVDKASHPEETAGEVKAWAERSAHTVDAALESAQDALASVSESIEHAREWTADKATQVDRVLAGAQAVVSQLDESVHAVQGSAARVVEALRDEDATASAAPADPEGEAVSDVVETTDFEDAPDGHRGVPRS